MSKIFTGDFMEILGNNASTPINGTAVRAVRNTLFPLSPGIQSKMHYLPGRNSGIPLDRETGKAIPLQREQGLVPLNSNVGNHNVAADKAKLRKAAEGFEAIFFRQMLKTMRSTVPEGNMYGSGSTGEMYADMVESSLADAMSQQGRLGIANTLYNQMVRRIDQLEMSRKSLSHPVSTQDGDR
jgi:flagellar protein FlgJ